MVLVKVLLEEKTVESTFGGEVIFSYPNEAESKIKALGVFQGVSIAGREKAHSGGLYQGPFRALSYRSLKK